MGRTTAEIAAAYRPLFTEYLESLGMADQYEVVVKELANPSLRFELHEKFPPKCLGAIEFECGDVLELMASDGDARRIVALRVDALLHSALSHTAL